MANITTIKNWFKTGLKPTQAQFWDTWDSFWHKDEQIPISKIEGIQSVYDAVNNHTNGADAHEALFNAINERIDEHETDENAHAELFENKADKTYVDNLVTGLWDDRGSYDASTNLFPSTGGSGTDGDILKGDIWTISVAGSLGDEAVQVGDTVRALVDSPSDTPSNWSILQNNIGYVPLNYDIDNYPSVTLPIVNTDKILINRSGGWKKLSWVDILNSIKTYILGGEIQLPAYTSARNDGQIPHNKVLSVDSSGNLKLYSIATAPAPFIAELVPDSYLPESTGNIRIHGDFFTPSMCDLVGNPGAIIIGGLDEIHYATFISSQEILVNVTTGSVEGSYSCTLNNGLSTTKTNALLLVYGSVFTPELADWETAGSMDFSDSGSARLEVFNVAVAANVKETSFITTDTEDYRLNWKWELSPLSDSSGSVPGYDDLNQRVALRRVSDNAIAYSIGFSNYFGDTCHMRINANGSLEQAYNSNVVDETNRDWSFRKVGSVWYLYDGNTVFRTFTYHETEDMYFEIKNKVLDVVEVKLITLT